MCIRDRYKNRYDRAQRAKKTRTYFPLMKGYIFVRLDGTRDWNELARRGLFRFLLGGANGRVYSFDEAWLRAQRKTFGPHFDPDRAGAGGVYSAPDVDRNMATFAGFAKGDMVAFAYGSLAGQEVKVTDIVDTQARVMFRLFGIEQSQLVPLSSLAKVR